MGIADFFRSWYGKSWTPEDATIYHLIWLRVLFRKNFILSRTRWKSQIAHFVIPLVVALVFIYGMYLEEVRPFTPQRRDHHILAQSEYPEVRGPFFKSRHKVYVFFKKRHMKEHVCGPDLHARLSGYTDLFEVQDLLNADQTPQEIKEDMKHRGDHMKDIIVFHDIKMKKGKPYLYYHIINDRWRLRKTIFPPYGPFFLPQQTNSDPVDLDYIVEAQKFIDLTFVECMQKNMTNGTFHPVPKDANRKVMRHYTAQPLYNYPIQSSQTLFVLINAVLQLMVLHELCFQIKDETVSGFKSQLRTLGIGRVKFFTAHLLYFQFKSFLMMMILMLPMVIYAKSASVLAFILGAYVYSFCVISIGILFSSIILTRGRRFDWALVIVWVTLHIDQWEFNDVSFHFPQSLFTMINPPSSWFFFNQYLVQMKMLGRDDAFPSLWFGGAHQMCGGLALVALLIDTFIIFFFAIYLDSIMAPSDEAPLHPFFFVMPPFWRKKQGDPQYEADNARVLYEEKTDPTGKDGTPATAASPDTSEPGVQIDGVGSHSNGDWKLQFVSLKAFQGQLMVLYGHKDSGYRLLMDLIAGRKMPTYGEVVIQGETVTKVMPQTVAVCGDRLYLLSDLTLRDHVEIYSNLRKGRSLDNKMELNDIATSLKIEDKFEMKIRDLNFSEKRRTSFLLAFAGSCSVVLISGVSTGCDITMKRTMEAKLHELKAKRTIIISSSNPVECEMLGERIAFFSRGRLIANGSLEFFKEKFGSAFVFSMWPSKGFDEEKAKLLCDLFITNIGEADVDNCYNQNLRFRLPPRKQSSYNEVLKELYGNQEKYGIKYFEMQKTGVEDIYTKIVEPDSAASEEMKKVENLEKLKELYETHSTGMGVIFSQILAVWLMRLKFILRHKMLFVATYILPVLIASTVGYAYTQYDQYQDFFCLNDIEKFGPGRIIADGTMKPMVEKVLERTKARNMHVEERPIKELHDRNNSWFFDFPAPMMGVYSADPSVKHNKTWVYSYALSFLQFGELVSQNLLSNTLLGGGWVRTCVNIAESNLYYRWIDVTKERKNRHAGLSAKAKESFFKGLRKTGDLSFIRSMQAFQFIAAIAIVISSAGLTIFPSRQRENNAMRMQYLYGLRPWVYWLANMIFDLLFTSLIGVLMLVALFVAMKTLISSTFAPPMYHWDVACVAWLLHFVIIAPVAYYASQNLSPSMAYTAILVYTGAPSLALLMSFVIHNVYSLHYLKVVYSQYFFCYISPTASASIIIGASVELGKLHFAMLDPFDVLSFPFTAMITHFWMWIVFCVWNLETFRRFIAHIKFVWARDRLAEKVADIQRKSRSASKSAEALKSDKDKEAFNYDELDVQKEFEGEGMSMMKQLKKEPSLKGKKEPSVMQSPLHMRPAGPRGPSAEATIAPKAAFLPAPTPGGHTPVVTTPSPGVHTLVPTPSPGVHTLVPTPSPGVHTVVPTPSPGGPKPEVVRVKGGMDRFYQCDEQMNSRLFAGAGSKEKIEKGKSKENVNEKEKGKEEAKEKEKSNKKDKGKEKEKEKEKSKERKIKSNSRKGKEKEKEKEEKKEEVKEKEKVKLNSKEAIKPHSKEKMGSKEKVNEKAHSKEVIKPTGKEVKKEEPAKPAAKKEEKKQEPPKGSPATPEAKKGEKQAETPKETPVTPEGAKNEAAKKPALTPTPTDKPESENIIEPSTDPEPPKESPNVKPVSVPSPSQSNPQEEEKEAKKEDHSARSVNKSMVKTARDDLQIKSCLNTNKNNSSDLLLKVLSVRKMLPKAEGTPGTFKLDMLGASIDGKVRLVDVTCQSTDAILGIYGWEGSGCTTLLEVVAGIIPRGSGTIVVNDNTGKGTLKKGVSFVPSKHQTGLLDYFTGREMLQHTCRLRGYSSDSATEVIDLLSRLLGFQDFLDEKISSYRVPDRTLLLAAMACTDRLDLLLIDDPAGSTCPKTQQILWSFMVFVRSLNTQVVFSTASPLETEYLSDMVMFIADGKSMECMPTSEMKETYTRCLQLVMHMNPGIPDDVVPQVIEQGLPKLKPTQRMHGNPRQICMQLHMVKGGQVHDVFKEVHELVLNLPVAEYSLTMTTFDEVYNYNFMPK